MLVVFAIICVLAVFFGGVLLVGAPYVPTLAPQIETALELLDLQPGQTLLELGSGDGKVLLAAARSGLQVVGIELNPLLVMVSWLRTRKYRKQVRIIWGDIWTVRWPEVDGVFSFLLGRFMPRLNRRMERVGKPLVSFAFQIPDKTPAQAKNGIFLYKY